MPAPFWSTDVIYHIATNDDWQEAIENGIYCCESLESEGFIHCSTIEQVIPVANRFYQGRRDLVLLAIDEKEVNSPVQFDEVPDSEEKFPHVYGPIDSNAIKRAVSFPHDDSGHFSLPQTLLTPAWWQQKPLAEFTQHEWESVCDGCARCCLYKLQDIDTDELFYTDVVCRFLDLDSCRCTDYVHRHEIMPTCIILTPQNLSEIQWMPATCAYRMLFEGSDLAWWHPLNSGDRQSTRMAGITIDSFAVSENEINMDNLQGHVQDWIDFI